MAFDSDTQKIDKKETDGLLGVSNSLSYRVHEIEKHFHSREVWFGRHSSVSVGVNEGEAWSQAPFTSIGGVTPGQFGAWIPLLGTGDTPFIANYKKFDPHRVVVTDTDSSKIAHLMQIAWGTIDAATALSAGDYTGWWAAPEKDGKVSPLDVHIPRIAAGEKMWFRHLVVATGEISSEMMFYLGIHEYIG